MQKLFLLFFLFENGCFLTATPFNIFMPQFVQCKATPPPLLSSAKASRLLLVCKSTKSWHNESLNPDTTLHYIAGHPEGSFQTGQDSLDCLLSSEW